MQLLATLLLILTGAGIIGMLILYRDATPTQPSNMGNDVYAAFQNILNQSPNPLTAFSDSFLFYGSAATKNSLVAAFVPPFVWLLLLTAIVTGIIILANKARKSASPTSGSTPLYETFYAPTDIVGLTRQGRKAIERVEQTVDSVMVAADETCGLVKDMEEIFVANLSAPQSEEEMALPEKIRKHREEERTVRARRRFREKHKMFAERGGNKRPVLECFENENSGASEDDMKEFKATEAELKEALGSAHVKLTNTKINAAHTALEFIEEQMTKTVQTSAVFEEGFQVGGMMALLKEEQAFYDASRQLITYLEAVKKTKSGTIGAIDKFENGEMTSDELRSLMPTPKPIQGKCRDGYYQYASYAGGMCCAEPPVDYNEEYKDYTTCNRGACSLIKELSSEAVPMCAANSGGH
jgi:hypothetical protein